MRDYQRKKLYNAEDAAYGGVEAYKVQEFKDMAECEAYALEIVSSKYWRKHVGNTEFLLKDGRSEYHCAAYHKKDKSIVLPDWAKNKRVMIHEFAHYLMDITQEDSVGHGSHFAGHLLMLVKELLGTHIAVDLCVEFQKHKVKYHLK